jgi:hypothetical protein
MTRCFEALHLGRVHYRRRSHRNYAHLQHGRIERQCETLVPMAQYMTRQAALPKSYCALAMAVARRIRNRVNSSRARGVPYESITCRRADFSSMRVFDCPCYVHVDKPQRRKLDDRAWKGVLVGYAPEFPAWLVYIPATRRVVGSRDVVFDEADVLPIGESCCALEVQRNDDKEDNTPDSHNPHSRKLCGEDPDTSWGEAPLRENKMLRELFEDERDMDSGDTALAPRPRYNIRSTASSKQSVRSPR